jgi:putative ABC transport system substrate-binding protein
MIAGMKRREFMALLGGAAAWPLPAIAQKTNGSRRLGILMAGAESDRHYQADVEAFQAELLKLGWGT